MAAACVPADDAHLGEAAQEFASPQPEVNLSDSGYGDPNDENNPPLGPASTMNPSVAWIRTPNHPTQGTPTKGTMLATYTRRSQHPTTGVWLSDAAWAYSSSWTASSANYEEMRANEWDPVRGRHQWPAPSNLCRYYTSFSQCGGGGASWNDPNLHHWSEPAAALWTGLDRTAAIVTTGGPSASLPNDAVFIVTSNDGGQSFQRSLIISIEEGGPHTMPEFDPLEPAGSGGNIISGSVHASLANFGERTSTLAGRVSLPIYVVWQHRPDYEDAEWWWTRVEVGESGYIAQTTPPRRLPSEVPREPGVQVSIFGYRIDGEERVAIAWGERGDQASPNACTSANSNIAVGWKAMTTEDLGETWGCFMGNEPEMVLPGGSSVRYFNGCADDVTTIATATNWPTCARVHATSPMPNSLRPEVAMNAPADGDNGIQENSLHRYFYFALTMPGSANATTTTSKVCLRRTGSIEVPLLPGAPAQDHDAILPVACTPNEDPSGRLIAQSYAPALAVAQGTTDGPRVEVSYRSLLREGDVARQEVMTVEHEFFPSDTPTPDVDDVSTVDFPLGVGQWGTRSGIAVYERCDPCQGCPNDPNYVGADAGFASVWSDTRRSLTPRVTDTFIRAFEWQ